MNLNHLAVFHAVAEEGAVGKGAERLFVSQPAVSKQIRELEASVGLKLFDRHPRGVRLTQAGEVLAEHARRLFAVEAEAEQAIAELKGLSQGSLKIGASLTIGIYLLPEILGEYRKKYPKIGLSLEIANTRDIQQKLKENGLDIALTEGYATEDGVGVLESEVFQYDELVAVVPAGHPLLKQTRVSVTEFCSEPFLMREVGSGTREVVERELIHHGIVVTPTMSLGSTEAIKRGVSAGLGVAIVSRLALAAEFQNGALCELMLTDFAVRRPLHIVRLRGKSENRAATAFFRLLRNMVMGG